ncbi:uncharacterized protein Dwil_GK19559 [Drosophila willistoni]|uniref:Uncharacterized protein n=2 Tax=Drosophila willistoni TaxID=7260 RepID=B4MNI1_DROWI|nr:uncharacterized protein Dwil_GK19559 [Drosophila willistoni]
MASPTKLICLVKRPHIQSSTPASTSSGACYTNRRELSHLCARFNLKWTIIELLCNLRSRYWMWRLHRMLDKEFSESEFLRGTREAAVVMIEAIRRADWACIHNCCTTEGSLDVYSLAQNGKTPLMDLIRFQSQHLRDAVPVNVARDWIDGKCYIFVDMAFIGIRNIRDFATTAEQDEMMELTQNALRESQMPEQLVPSHSRIFLAEILITFRRELISDAEEESEGEGADWLVDAYKVFRFKLVNFSPVTLQCRVIEFLKPV